MSIATPNVAVVHDQLYTMGGAEQVLKEILNCFPGADLYVLFDLLQESDRGFLAGHRVHTTSMQQFFRIGKYHRHYLPFMPFQIEQLNLQKYDIIISSSYLVAKGVLVGPDQLHVSYIHSPMRYAWDMQFQYLREMGLEKGWRSVILRRILHRMRLWDHRSAAGVDRFVANSRYIARRVRKAYRREASVVYPPIGLERMTLRAPPPRGDTFVTVSRLVPYKRIDLLVEAFRELPDQRLVVIGDGPERPRLEALAGPNVRLLGRQPDEIVVEHLHRAAAFLFAAEEDFGIVPVEAQACGTPVIAYGRGGACETVVGAGADATGLLFEPQTPPAAAAAVRRFLAERDRFRPAACRANAERFGAERFRREFLAEVDTAHRRLLEERGAVAPAAPAPDVAG
jgi:glycosyltransferase involved in cell wall biosynthesis